MDTRHNKDEILAGIRDTKEIFALIRRKYPAAFPDNLKDIRPLKVNIAREIGAALGYSSYYIRGALRRYVMSGKYCHAVLRYDDRVGLDGEPCGERIDEAARTLARIRLAKLKHRRERQAREREVEAPEIASAA